MRDSMSNGTVNKIISEDYADMIVEYYGNLNLLKRYGNYDYTILDERIAIIHIPLSELKQPYIKEYGWSSIPYVGGLMDASSLVSSGISRVQNIPNFSLKGQGVLVGFVDTGIDYVNQVFKNADNTTRIVSIWDQTIENPDQRPEGLTYGTEFTKEQINAALASNTPMEIVPSNDQDGHGTMMAGITAGSVIAESDFSGVVPDSEIIMVKLKPAKKYLREFYLIPENEIANQVTDINLGIGYLVNVSKKLNRPLVICIGLGTMLGEHNGRGVASRRLSYLAGTPGIATVIAAGNEGNRGGHYYGEIDSQVGYDTVELNVAKDETGFTMELFGNAPNVFSIDILSPSGELVSRIPAKLGEGREIKFIFEKTTIYLDYQLLEEQSGNELILFRFKEPAEGIWRIRVYGTGNISMNFHIWLPIHQYIKEGTRFTRPNIYTTITNPANGIEPIAVTAYDHINQNLYNYASRGFTSSNIVKPEIAAPGVEVFAPTLNNSFTRMTGSSAAAAITAGVAAMLLEWGIVNGNLPGMDTSTIKKILIAGAKRDPVNTYPNKDWGYGILDIYNSFIRLRGD